MRRYRLEEYTQYDKRNDEIKIVKTKKTPAKYPRKAGTPSKEPIK